MYEWMDSGRWEWREVREGEMEAAGRVSILLLLFHLLLLLGLNPPSSCPRLDGCLPSSLVHHHQHQKYQVQLRLNQSGDVFHVPVEEFWLLLLCPNGGLSGSSRGGNGGPRPDIDFPQQPEAGELLVLHQPWISGNNL